MQIHFARIPLHGSAGGIQPLVVVGSSHLITKPVVAIQALGAIFCFGDSSLRTFASFNLGNIVSGFGLVQVSMGTNGLNVGCNQQNGGYCNRVLIHDHAIGGEHGRI